MKIIVVNDARSQIPGSTTLWDDLCGWLKAEFVGDVPFDHLAEKAASRECELIVRNGSYFGPIVTKAKQISIIQDIILAGPQREMQWEVMKSSAVTVFNSDFTASKYPMGFVDIDNKRPPTTSRVVPLPVDFSLFEPGNAMGLQTALALPDGAVCWIGASVGAAGAVKGWDIFLNIVRRNPDIPFVGVFKDEQPEYAPLNLRMFTRLTHEELVRVIGACRVGLCTSRMESQHLAGIEMGACGLPMVAPQTGTYWKRTDMPGILVDALDVGVLASAVRATLANAGDPQQIRSYWQRKFDKPVIKSAWERLIEEVENDGQAA